MSKGIGTGASAVLTLTVAASLAAQSVSLVTSSRAQELATIEGVVFDSLRGGVLRDATVMVSTLGRVGISDQAGRFRIDSVVPGVHRLSLFHAMLDTVGIEVTTAPTEFRAGSTTVNLGIPSARTILDAACSPSAQRTGLGGVIGRVIDADSGEPVAGAHVSLGWTEVVWSGGNTYKRTVRSMDASTPANGTFRFCGLRTDLEALVAAQSGEIATAPVSVVFDSIPLVIRTLRVASAASAPAVSAETGGPDSAGARVTGEGTLRTGGAILRGRVVTRTGVPLRGTHISVNGAFGSAVSDSNGDFQLERLPPGTQSLLARKVGYVPIEETVELSSGRPQEVRLELQDYIPVLEEVRVVGSDEPGLDVTGFYGRRRAGSGQFMALEDIERHGARQLTDLLGAFSGIGYTVKKGKRQVTGLRGGCVNIYIDGYLWHDYSDDDDIADYVAPEELAGIEVYGQASVPGQFYGTIGARPCGAIVMWTRVRLKQRLRPPS